MAEDVVVPEAGKPAGSKGFSEAAAGTCPPTHTHTWLTLKDGQRWGATAPGGAGLGGDGSFGCSSLWAQARLGPSAVLGPLV